MEYLIQGRKSGATDVPGGLNWILVGVTPSVGDDGDYVSHGEVFVSSLTLCPQCLVYGTMFLLIFWHEGNL